MHKSEKKPKCKKSLSYTCFESENILHEKGDFIGK